MPLLFSDAVVSHLFGREINSQLTVEVVVVVAIISAVSMSKRSRHPSGFYKSLEVVLMS